MTERKRYEITVVPKASYLADRSDPAKNEYVFSYTITITNTGDVAAQLVSRHWIITDADHKVQEVRGLGVVGQQPLLQPGESFEYTSGASIPTAVGTMRSTGFTIRWTSIGTAACGLSASQTSGPIVRFGT